MKKISCRYLQRAIFYAPDELRHCCKRYFVNGELKGDVKIFEASDDKDITLEKIIRAKKNLIKRINNKEKTDCFGCPVLESKEWRDLEDEKFDHISIEHHAKCNMRCTYCNETYYGGNLAKYDIKSSLKELVEKNLLRDDLQVAWGGGEPTIVKDFTKLLSFVNESMNPKTQRFFTNAINYSEEIAELLKSNKGSVTTSVDAGTVETFKKVRKVNQYEKVLKNLKKYYDCSPNNLVIKYILTEDNSSYEEINSFAKDMIKLGLSKANFLISSNYWNEKITFHQGLLIIYFQDLLSENGAMSAVLDDHVRPRISKIAKELLKNDEILSTIPDEMKIVVNKVKSKKNLAKEIIVWGIGEYANLVLDNSVTFSESKVKFFVDSSPYKQGKIFRNCKVLEPNQITSSNLPILIASSFWYHDILAEIKSLGVNPERIIVGSYI